MSLARLSTLLALNLLALAGTLSAAPVRLELGPETGVAVRPAVLRGYNFGNWMQVAEFTEPLASLKPALLRFPAGNIGDEFDLTETSLRLARAGAGQIGSPPLLVQTRVFQGRPGQSARNGPEDAAAAVRLGAALKIATPYWEIGNEPDLYAEKRGDPTWTAARYCAVFRAQAAAIRAVDPQARIAGPAVSGAIPGRDRFIEDFVHDCGDIVDVLSWHLYPSEGEMSDEAALATATEASRTLVQMRALWQDPRRNPLGHQRRIGFGVTEYGLSWRTERPRHLSDMVGALWAAETALRLNEGDAEIAQYFALQGTGGHGLLDQAGVPRPSRYAFSLLARLSGHFVGVTSPSAGLWLHGARDRDHLSILALNPQPEPVELSPALPGYRLERVIAFDEGQVEAESPLTEAAPRESLSLPPRAMALLVYSRL